MNFSDLARLLLKLKALDIWHIYMTSLLMVDLKKNTCQLLDKAFKCLLKAGLKINLSKCLFFKEQIHYLGHLVSRTTILPFPDKMEALMKLKFLTNIKDV